MAFLHENKEEFINAVNLASKRFGILPIIAEKDYYVTMILRVLSERLDFIVFKGGTSLSKCYKAIKRFSEDIDLTSDKKLSQGQMRKLKDAIKSTADEIGLKIPNIDETRSRRNYNQYVMGYESSVPALINTVQNSVLLETSFAEISFPTVVLPVRSYIGDMMMEEAPEELSHYLLEPFDMKVQGLDRTLTDKVFAVCDYYMQNKVKNHSRHLYDIYKLLPIVPLTEEYRHLIHEVRIERAKNDICPSAKQGVRISEILNSLIKNEAYRNDYESVTSRILEEEVSYEMTVDALRNIIESGIFDETD